MVSHLYTLLRDYSVFNKAPQLLYNGWTAVGGGKTVEGMLVPFSSALIVVMMKPVNEHKREEVGRIAKLQF